MGTDGMGDEGFPPAQPAGDETTTPALPIGAGDEATAPALPMATATSDTTPSATAAPERPRKPKRRRGLWIALTIILLLLIILGAAGGVGYFAYQQYPALNTLGVRFCNDLLNQKYSDAYSLLSTRLRKRYSASVFVSMSQTLDTTEGKVTLCGQDASNSFHLNVFPLTVSVATDVTRATLGKRKGDVKLVYENGRWAVDDIATALLGVNIDALLTAQSLCADLSIQAVTPTALTQKYSAIWSLYDSAAQAKTTKAYFLEIGQLHDEIDNNVESCAITSIGKDNTDSFTQVQYTSKRTLAVVMQATATLRPEHGVWKFATLDPSVYGRDMAPALAATQWLAAMASGDCATAYAALSTEVQKRFTLAAFTAQICSKPVDWERYNLDPTTYTQESTSKYVDDLTDETYFESYITLAEGGRPDYTGVITLVDENGMWQVDGVVAQ